MAPDGEVVASNDPLQAVQSSSASPITALPQTLNNAPNPIAEQAVKIEQPTGPQTNILFAKDAHDFGNIEQNSTDNKHTFTFTNTGTNPLIISNAKGSCGCTVPVWPKEPIPPGGTGTIEVEYKPGSQKGTQKKTVTVTANTTPPDTRLSISAEVEEVAAAQ
ncbi:MAG: DUF1573 domain-containing protein [Flavobacteriales bacterium]|nr:DUF1573 domain-containing protein [Flavobacteriales bacterium]